MRIVYGLGGLADRAVARSGGTAAHSAVTIGVFDGMHLGHQRMIQELLELAASCDGTPTVITFENHPDAVVRGRRPEPLISVPHRIRLLRRAGVQQLVLLQFDLALQQLTAERFAREILAEGLHTRGLLVGFDSRIGKDRGGTPARLRELGDELGFAVREACPVEVDGEPVSSTRIRDAIHAGDLDLAARLLGRRPSVFGTVVHGDHRGRTLGFPTANLLPEDQATPPHGVYAVEILHESEQYLGVANLGTRPTFAGADATRVRPSLEVHFLDRDLDLYGATLEVAFVSRLRGERQFANAEELRAQIGEDVGAARRALGG